jgi:hypothetical protein
VPDFTPPEIAQLFEELEREVALDRATARRLEDPRTAREWMAALFSSTRLALLGLLYGQPDRRFHINELMAWTGCGSGATQRELARLHEVGLLVADWDRGRKRFQADNRVPIHAELCALFRKGVGLAAPVREALGALDASIEAAFVTEPAPHCSPGPPPLRLVLIADVWPEGLDEALDQMSRQLGRRVDAIVLEAPSFRDNGYFIQSLLAGSRVWVKGSEAAFAALRHARP